jgi:hypothetical protein
MKDSEMTLATPDNPKSQQQMRHIVPDHQVFASKAVCSSSGTGAQTPWLWRALLPICAAALVNLAACTTQSGSMSVQGKPVSGYVEMTQVQAAYLGSGNAGNGTLRYRGHTYPFTVGGLGVGGIGISKIEARGEVYGLERLRDFPGAYIQGRYGLALGTVSTGDLWLKNGNGVIMRLVAKRQGLMLSLGGDAVVIQMNQ